jgi:replication factor C subunit 1
MTSLEWTTTHAPKAVGEMVGSKSGPESLLKWLRSWSGQGKPPQTRVALVTGPTGCGKTLLAHLACKDAGISSTIELNTMAKRTKKAITQVEDAFRSKNMASMFSKTNSSKPGAVIVDDIDACDQGGLTQILIFARKSKVPVICTASSSYNRALKSLADMALGIRLFHPSPDQLAGYLMGVVRVEAPRAVFPQSSARTLAVACGCDVRQALIELRMTLMTNSRAMIRNDDGSLVDRPIGLFDVVPRLFKPTANGSVSFAGESDRLYHSDRQMVPAMVAENYVRTSAPLAELANAAEYVSLGDTMARRSPAEIHGFMSVTMPCAAVHTTLKGRAEFPASLAQEGRANAREKTLTAAARCMTAATATTHTALSFAVEDAPGLKVHYVDTLALTVKKNPKAVGVIAQAIAAEMHKMYGLGRDDWDLVSEVATFPPNKPADGVTATAKAALTRAFTTLVGKGEPAAKKRKIDVDDDDSD